MCELVTVDEVLPSKNAPAEGTSATSLATKIDDLTTLVRDLNAKLAIEQRSVAGNGAIPCPAPVAHARGQVCSRHHVRLHHQQL
jgi:hypothetical protein